MATEASPSQLQRIELKFEVDVILANQVRDWARQNLGLDANCHGAGDTYDLNTLYLDTHDLDLFHRTGVAGSSKHRIRRYGDEQTLWLETKRKRRMVVRKNRTAVFESDMQLESAPSSSSEWCGDWFLERVFEHKLQPTVEVSYRRFARTATIGGQDLRLTIDSQMSASGPDGWSVSKATEGRKNPRVPFGTSEILELKFHNQLPHLFRELLRTFVIPSTRFSKYRAAVVASGRSSRNLRSNGARDGARDGCSDVASSEYDASMNRVSDA